MKKYSLLLLSVALLAGCANSTSKQSNQKTQTSSTVQLSKADQKTLDNATAEYKDFVAMQIDQLLEHVFLDLLSLEEIHDHISQQGHHA